MELVWMEQMVWLGNKRSYDVDHTMSLKQLVYASISESWNLFMPHQRYILLPLNPHKRYINSIIIVIKSV